MLQYKWLQQFIQLVPILRWFPNFYVVLSIFFEVVDIPSVVLIITCLDTKPSIIGQSYVQITLLLWFGIVLSYWNFKLLFAISTIVENAIAFNSASFVFF
ncbi:MAG: hypothetical protein R2829_00330 [Bacteroidia bacterium]